MDHDEAIKLLAEQVSAQQGTLQALTAAIHGILKVTKDVPHLRDAVDHELEVIHSINLATSINSRLTEAFEEEAGAIRFALEGATSSS